MTPPAQQPEKAPHPVLIRMGNKTFQAKTDGWICIKYLDCGEESLSTFADISNGEYIQIHSRSRPHTTAQCPELSPVNTPDGIEWLCNKEAIRNATRKELLKDLQSFIDSPESREGCPTYALSIAHLIQWMGGQGWDCD